MNDRDLDKKVSQDAAKVKKDLSALLEHSATRAGRYGKQVSQVTGKTQENVTVWIEDGISYLAKSLSKLAGNSADMANSVKKDVSHSLNKANVKAMKAVGIVPDSLAKKASRSPWIVVSIGLLLGVGLGFFLRPAPPVVAANSL